MELQQKKPNPAHELVQNYDPYQYIYLSLCSLGELRGRRQPEQLRSCRVLDLWFPGAICWHRARLCGEPSSSSRRADAAALCRWCKPDPPFLDGFLGSAKRILPAAKHLQSRSAHGPLPEFCFAGAPEAFHTSLRPAVIL